MRALLHKLAAALPAYGPWGVFLLSLFDSMGVPLPAVMDVFLIGVAAASSQSPSHAWLAALMAILGSAGGNVVLFQAARQGRRLFTKGDAAPGKGRRFEKWFHRYGLVTVFVPAIVPIVPLPLKVFVISAGALHTPFGRFLAVILLARVVRYFGLAWLGLQLGEDASGFLTRNGWTLAGIALGLALALVLLIRLGDRRQVV
jgi:membrane protein YqaA with SNARE-associated domain